MNKEAQLKENLRQISEIQTAAHAEFERWKSAHEKDEIYIFNPAAGVSIYDQTTTIKLPDISTINTRIS